jgi:hypothetical protein
MIEAWMAELEATVLAAALRGSVWAYPLVNAGHILGVALLIGSIVPLDLRLLGLWQAVPLASLWRVLTRTAGCGLGLAMICGMLLFITRATQYANSSLFIAKMVIVVAGLVNALVLHLAMPDHRPLSQWTTSRLPARIRFAACISLAGWLSALTLGRLVGYF